MQYRLVFDTMTREARLWPVAIPLVFAVVGGVGVLRPAIFRAGSAKLNRVVSGGLVLGGCGMAIFIWRDIVDQQAYFRDALRAGRYTLVEGRVQNFVPGGAGCHPKEEFDVGGHHYWYSACSLSSAFQQTAGESGPVRDGVRVRIADVDGNIVRLEIAP
jgi:hypothetical protein